MPIVIPVPIPAAPAAPQRNDPATFEERNDAAIDYQFDTLPAAIDQQAGATYQNALASKASAEAAEASKNAANGTVEAAAEQVALAADQVALAAEQAGESALSAAASEASHQAAMAVAAAFGDGAGLPSLAGKAGCVLAVDETEMGVGWVKPPANVPTPVNLSPADGAVGVKGGPLTGSTYYSLYGKPQKARQARMSLSSTFASILWDSGVAAGAGVSVSTPEFDGLVPAGAVVYWHMRYQDADGAWSEWAQPTTFSAASTYMDYIPIPAATPAIGAPFEGGFYKGMLWNELAQSSTSMAIGIGAKVFTVPNMSASPIVYAGQQLEIRSRANPANKFIGTVTGAKGAALTLNITSIGGSGTFSDWSIMARYRMIDAPKSSGEHAGIALKSTNSALPVACQTLAEGWKATLSMVAAGDAATYPAAHWARSLAIGGRNDWFIDARDGLDLSWRNLKPVTDANSLARSGGAAYDYKNLGSVSDVSPTANGANLNSSPAGAAYSANDPAQTSAPAFRAGGAEAFSFGGSTYWSSSDFNASYAWAQYWYTGPSGGQYDTGKSNANRVRAVRRSII